MHDLSTGGQLARKFQLVHSPGLVWACSGNMVTIESRRGGNGGGYVRRRLMRVEQFARLRGNTRVRLFQSRATKQREKSLKKTIIITTIMSENYHNGSFYHMIYHYWGLFAT
jgi:hypothetical protein